MQQKKLTKNVIEQLNIFNTQLVQLENKIYKIAQKKAKIVLKELLEKENEIVDFELELVIHYYKNKDDEDELVSHKELLKQDFLSNRRSYIADGMNHNVCSIYNISELTKQHHCWLLHTLYDDYFIDFDDILNIGYIWFDIQVIYQYDFHINKTAT